MAISFAHLFGSVSLRGLYESPLLYEASGRPMVVIGYLNGEPLAVCRKAFGNKPDEYNVPGIAPHLAKDYFEACRLAIQAGQVEDHLRREWEEEAQHLGPEAEAYYWSPQPGIEDILAVNRPWLEWLLSQAREGHVLQLQHDENALDGLYLVLAFVAKREEATTA